MLDSVSRESLAVPEWYQRRSVCVFKKHARFAEPVVVAAGNVSAGCTAWKLNQNVSSQRYSEIISSMFCAEKNQV